MTWVLGNEGHRPPFLEIPPAVVPAQLPTPDKEKKKDRRQKENQKKGFSAPLLHEYLRSKDLHRMDEAKRLKGHLKDGNNHLSFSCNLVRET